MKHVLVLLTREENVLFSVSGARQLITTLASFLLRSNMMQTLRGIFKVLNLEVLYAQREIFGAYGEECIKNSQLYTTRSEY